MTIEDNIKNQMSITKKSRLEVIANLDLGYRSDLAKRLIEKRARRLELLTKGFDFLTIRLIISKEYE